MPNALAVCQSEPTLPSDKAKTLVTIYEVSQTALNSSNGDINVFKVSFLNGLIDHHQDDYIAILPSIAELLSQQLQHYLAPFLYVVGQLPTNCVPVDHMLWTKTQERITISQIANDLLALTACSSMVHTA